MSDHTRRGAMLVRNLRILQLLTARKYRVSDLARAIGEHPRTVYRDLAAMQEAHLPIVRDAAARYQVEWWL